MHAESKAIFCMLRRNSAFWRFYIFDLSLLAVFSFHLHFNSEIMSFLILKLGWYFLLVAELVVAPPEAIRVCLEANEFRELFHIYLTYRCTSALSLVSSLFHLFTFSTNTQFRSSLVFSSMFQRRSPINNSLLVRAGRGSRSSLHSDQLATEYRQLDLFRDMLVSFIKGTDHILANRLAHGGQ